MAATYLSERDVRQAALSGPPPGPGRASDRTPNCIMAVRIDPPALNLSPTSSRALVTIATGATGRELLSVSGPLMRDYAERVGADFVVLDWECDDWPMGSKFQIPRVLDHYERAAYVDADVLLRPGCINLFEQCDPEEFGAFNELPEQIGRGLEAFNFLAEFDFIRRYMGFEVGYRAAVPWYLSAGVMVFSRAHRAAFVPPPPDRPFPAFHCSEQHWWTAQLIAAQAPVRTLPRTCNWMRWAGFENAPADAVLHFAGDGDGMPRIEEMREWEKRCHDE